MDTVQLAQSVQIRGKRKKNILGGEWRLTKYHNGKKSWIAHHSILFSYTLYESIYDFSFNTNMWVGILFFGWEGGINPKTLPCVHH